MKRRDEFDDLTDEEIDVEIAERQELIKQMVGTLYPDIMCDEIDTLVELKEDPLRRARSIVEKTKPL